MPEPQIPLRLRQRAAERGDFRRLAAGAERAAAPAARALYRAAVGHPLYRAAGAEPARLALSPPPLGDASGVPPDRQWPAPHRAVPGGRAVAEPAALEPPALPRQGR